MSFDWVEFLELAYSLAFNPDSPGPQEAALRSAISRAYYAAFHCALDRACKEGFVPTNKGSDHYLVREHFNDPNRPSRLRYRIYSDLNRLYADRRAADYENRIAAPQKTAESAVKVAKRMLGNLDNL